jgi:hypothetical protein
MGNALVGIIIGTIIGTIVGIVLGVTVVTPRLKHDAPAGSADAEFRRVWRSLKTFRSEYAIWRELSQP